MRQKGMDLTFVNRTREKIQTLTWIDICVVTVILFGNAIYSSTESYLLLLQGSATIDGNLTFDVSDNYRALMQQAAFLLCVLLYLRLRNFDFKTWNLRITPKAVAYGCLMFVCGALIMDGYSMVVGTFESSLPFPSPIAGFFGNETVSTVIYALLNGFYEEIFFLGVCLAVGSKNLKWAIPFGLIVRLSFHTYQGMVLALGLGILLGGLVYLVYWRSKDKNLMPFFIAHTLADIFGLGLLHFIAA